MEATRRERIIFFGIVPVVSALVGAVGTVIATRMFGAGEAGDAIRAVVTDPSLSAQAKVKMIELINANDQQFYELMRNIFTTGAMLTALIIGGGYLSRR